MEQCVAVSHQVLDSLLSRTKIATASSPPKNYIRLFSEAAFKLLRLVNLV